MAKFYPILVPIILFVLSGCTPTNDQGTDTDSDVPAEEVNEPNDEPTGQPAPKGAFKVLDFDDVEVPELDYPGNIESGLYWEDAMGLNYLLLTTQSNSPIDKDGDTLRTKFYATHFQKAPKKDEWVKAWSFIDIYREMEAAYIIDDKYLAVTDLNKDDLGEATILFRREGAQEAGFKVVAVTLINEKQYEGQHFVVHGRVPADLTDSYDAQVEKEIVENAGIVDRELYENYASQIWDNHNADWKRILESL